MIRIHPSRDEHDKFKKLIALAVSGNVTTLESVELQAHLKNCEECHEVFRQYQTLTTLGMTVLADECAESQEQANWDTTPVLEHLLARVRADHVPPRQMKVRSRPPSSPEDAAQRGTKWVAWIAAAAGLILTVAAGAYYLGMRSHKVVVIHLPAISADSRAQELSGQKQQADELVAAQSKKLTQLQADSAEKSQELAKLRSELRDIEDNSKKLQDASSQSKAQLASLSAQRDSLTAQLQGLTQAYENDKSELAKVRTDRDSMLLQTSSLEAKIADLTTANREQERRLNDTEQYLSSDRDIRELMGARKLYIADVFDVDGSSRTQKPFGRVFYTQGKSLIFYAFDLDREPGVVNASTFQVWGQREAPQGEQAMPMNLGILYMDNESNRRWVMRFDDPKKLAEIDAVFVTVEPRGGSHKPTSKPFLYALLRNEANHP
jgi:Anti-sigma-K factor rskA